MRYSPLALALSLAVAVTASTSFGQATQTDDPRVRELLAMGRAALDHLDTDESEIERLENDYRENDMARLQAQIEAGDLHAGKERNILRRSGAQT